MPTYAVAISATAGNNLPKLLGAIERSLLALSVKVCIGGLSCEWGGECTVNGGFNFRAYTAPSITPPSRAVKVCMGGGGVNREGLRLRGVP